MNKKNKPEKNINGRSLGVSYPVTCKIKRWYDQYQVPGRPLNFMSVELHADKPIGQSRTLLNSVKLSYN